VKSCVAKVVNKETNMTIADRPFAATKSTETDQSSSVVTRMSGNRSAGRRRAQVVLLTFGFFAALAAIIALRAAISLQAFHH